MTIATSEIPDNSPVPILKTLDLSKRYGKFNAVKNVNITVYKGETYGLIGRNGAGKTSMLQMLSGVAPPTSGKLELFGQQSREVTNKIKLDIGFVPQEQVFYPWMNGKQLAKFLSGFYPSWDHDTFKALAERIAVP